MSNRPELGFDPAEPLPPARRRLVAVLMGHGWRRTEVDEMLDSFAHELAEQQRYEHDEVGGGCDLGVCHGDALPDLIDPQASAGPVRPDEEPTT